MTGNPIRTAFEVIDPDASDEFREELRERCLVELSAGDATGDSRTGRSPTDSGSVKEIDLSLNSRTNEARNRRRMALAAAAVIAVIGVTAIAFAISNSNGDDKTPSPTAVATVAPTTSVAPTTTVAPTMVPIGFDVPSANDIPVTFMAPDDWNVQEGWSAYTEGAGVLFDGIANIYADGCQWVLLDPPVGPTVDDLVSAWAEVPDFAATAAVDITVDGYAGKQIEFTVRDYEKDECRGTSPGQLGLWRVNPSGAGDSPDHSATPNQHLRMWVLDVDGTRLVIGAGTFPSTTPQERAALDQVLASIEIG